MKNGVGFRVKRSIAMLMANILCCAALAFSSILCMGNWWEPKMPQELKK